MYWRVVAGCFQNKSKYEERGDRNADEGCLENFQITMMCMKIFTIRSNTFTRLTHTGVQSKIYDVALNMVGERLLKREISERYKKHNEQD